MAVSPDGTKVISGSGDETLKVWDLKTKQEIFLLADDCSYIVSAVAVTPHGRWVISGSYDSTLKVWDLETGEKLFTLSDGEDSVHLALRSWISGVAVTADRTKGICAASYCTNCSSG